MSDPVRAHFEAALARRLQAAPEAVQRVMQERQRAWPARTAPTRPAGNPQGHPLSPLGQLNRDIAASAASAAPGRELRSVHGFRESWSRLSAEDDVTRAVQRGPENAGPLNSHRLVLRTLTLMRDLSPDYLRRFLSHVDTLLWLDQAQPPARPRPLTARPRTGRAKK